MIFEYRTYYIAPGQRAALHEHMEHATLPVFEKVGVAPIGFWEPDVGALNRLHYIVQYADYSDRQRRWGAWLTHPERKYGVAADGTPLIDRVVNEIWEPTDYSEWPIDSTRTSGAPWIYEFHRHQIRRDVANYHVAWREALRLMHRHDIRPLGFWLTLVGNAPTLNYILPFENAAARDEKMAAYYGDPEKRAGFADDGKPFTHVDVVETWRPTQYSHLR